MPLQLETHHPDGTVSHTPLTNARPLLIGSASNCDLVLRGADIKRVHCRILWKDDRWRVEVSKDAGTIKLGDRVIQGGRIHPGDVLGIGGYRIYVDDGSGAHPRSDEAVEPSAYADVMDDDAGPDAPTAAPAYAPMTGRGGAARPSAAKSRDQRGFFRRAWDGIRQTASEQVQGEVDRAPGEERLLGSPLVRWLLIAVAVITLSGTFFYLDYHRRTILDHFDKADKAMAGQNWEGASKAFESFVESYATHALASPARVKKAICEVESSASPAAALATASKLVRELGKEDGFAALAPRLGETLVRVTQSLADAARDRADEKSLEQSETAEELLRGLPGAVFSPEAQQKLEKARQDAKFAIKKSDDRADTLAAMDKAINGGKTADAYRAREDLIRLYSKDFGEKEDPDIKDQMDRANKYDRDSVKADSKLPTPRTDVRPSGVTASTVLVELTSNGQAAAPAGDVVFALAGGVYHAHDAVTGKSLWHRVAGADARALPVSIAGAAEPTVVFTDTRHDELVAVKSRDGSLVWRLPLAEPIECPPLVRPGRIYQVTAAGSLFVIDGTSGRVVSKLHFPEQRFRSTPTVNDGNSHLYILSDQYDVFVVSLANPMKCESVLYLGHPADSVFAAPLRVGRYLVVCENATAQNARLRVLLLSNDSSSLEEIQKSDIPVSGWVHHVPAVRGLTMFVATDQENVMVYSAGSAEKADGFARAGRALAGETINPRPQPYVVAYSDSDLLVAGSRFRYYGFNAQQQDLAPKILDLAGTVSQAIQAIPPVGRADTLYLGRRLPDSSAVIITAVGAADIPKLAGDVKVEDKAKPKWEVLLGAALSSLAAAENGDVRTITRGGLIYRIPAAQLSSGGVIEQPTARLGIADEVSNEFDPVPLADGNVLFVSTTKPDALVVYAPDGATAKSVQLPAAVQVTPVAFGDGVLVAAGDGRVYWLNPTTGKQLADPFQPPLQTDKPVRWRGLALSAKGTIVAADQDGTVYLVELRKEPTPHLVSRSDSKLPKPIRSVVTVVGNVAACVGNDNVLRTFDAETLAPIGDSKLAGATSLGPSAAGNHLFAVAGAEEVICMNPQGQLAWRHLLKGETIAGRPSVKGDLCFLAFRSGSVTAIKLADGTVAWTVSADKPLSSGIVAAGELLVVAGEDGSINVVQPPAAP